MPPHPERDLLWFIATYAPEMESWERDIFLAVREESFYFYPVFATQIMNEGWASYWHARLLREADFIPQATYLDAIKCHSDVVRPVATGEQVALTINPYHLGFTLWEEIVKNSGIEAARQVMREDDDFSFLRNHLTREIAAEMGLFRYQRQQNGPIRSSRRTSAICTKVCCSRNTTSARRASWSPKCATTARWCCSTTAGSTAGGSIAERARKVLEYVKHVWRRPVLLKTVDAAAAAVEFSADSAA